MKPQQSQAPVVVSAGPRIRCFGSSFHRQRREEGLAAQEEASARSENECTRFAQGRNSGTSWGWRQGPRPKRGAEVRHSTQQPQTIPRGAGVKSEGKLKGQFILTQQLRPQSGGALLRGMPRRPEKMRSWGAALKEGEGTVPFLRLLLPAQPRPPPVPSSHQPLPHRWGLHEVPSRPTILLLVARAALGGHPDQHGDEGPFLHCWSPGFPSWLPYPTWSVCDQHEGFWSY